MREIPSVRLLAPPPWAALEEAGLIERPRPPMLVAGTPADGHFCQESWFLTLNRSEINPKIFQNVGAKPPHFRVAFGVDFRAV
jgi:hypothetical protein